MERKDEPRLEERVTKIIVNACDGGQHGSTSCGNCDYTLKEDDSLLKCPECDYRFEGTELSRSVGGTDYPI